MDNKNEILFDATATVRGYQCGMSGKAMLQENKYKYHGYRDCTVTFILRDKKLIVEFFECDTPSYCGIGANWTDGDYLLEDF